MNFVHLSYNRLDSKSNENVKHVEVGGFEFIQCLSLLLQQKF